MEPVRTLAAALLLAISAVSDVQAPPAGQATPIPAALYTPAVTMDIHGGQAASAGEAAADAPEHTSAPTPSAEPSPTPMAGGMTRNLYRRLEGEDVAALQSRLRELGYLQGAADGIFGRETYRAVIAFQKAHDLEPDGIAGANTLAWLFSDEAYALPTATPAPTPAPTDEPEPTPAPTPIPTATPVPTAQLPDSWLKDGQEDSPVTALAGRAVYAAGEAVEGIGVYADEDGRELIPLRALIHALSYPEKAHEDGGAYEFDVPGTDGAAKTVALGCEADGRGYVAQAMVMIDGYLYVPDASCTLVRWGEEIYVPLELWNEVAGEPALSYTRENKE